MRSTGWVLGYHGCDEELGEAVLRGDKPLQPSANDYDWLGAGIYFWEGDPKRALDWAEDAMENPAVCKTRITKPFALGAIIDPGYCLDLMESASVYLVKMAHLSLEAQYDSQGWEKPRNAGSTVDRVQRKLDRAVINFLHDVRENEAGETAFDSVRFVHYFLKDRSSITKRVFRRRLMCNSLCERNRASSLISGRGLSGCKECRAE